MFKDSEVIQSILVPRNALLHDDLELSQLVNILREQKLLAIFTNMIMQDNLLEQFPEKARKHMLNSLVLVELQNEQVENEAVFINEALKDISDTLIFLKGAAYSLAGYNFAKTRSYSDIDVLVPKEKLKKCEQALVLDGWMMQDITNYDDQYYRKWAHEIPPMQHMARGTVIDIHHNLVPVISGDAPKPELLFRHITKLESGVQIFTREAQFVHSAVHLLRNEDYQFGLRDLFDLFFMLEESDETFTQRCINVSQDFGFEYETGLGFYLLNQRFKCGIDDCVIRELLASKPSIRTKFDCWLMTRVLRLNHSMIYGNKKHQWFIFLAMIRGHMIKMPLPLLVYHLSVKLGRYLMQTIFGKHVFTPEEVREGHELKGKQ